MLHGIHARSVIFNSCPAGCVYHIVCVSLYYRFFRQVHTLKAYAISGAGGLYGHRHISSGVQPYAMQGYRAF